MLSRLCPQCNREITEPKAAFCPFCGMRLMVSPAETTPPGAAQLLRQAADQTNNRKKLALLQKARTEYPDCLAVEEEWLFQGKLPEKAPRTLDYSYIKCHLLHLYLTPEDFTAHQQAAMRQELFEDDQLKHCLSLADSPEGFMVHYLERLCREFIQVFLFGSNQYMPRFMGFQLERNAAKVLAKPAAQVIRTIRADEALTPEQRASLSAAFEAAFAAECGGDLRWFVQEMAD